MAKKDPRLTRAGVSGFNKPKRTPSHPKKSHVVVAKQGDKVKTIRLASKALVAQARIHLAHLRRHVAKALKHVTLKTSPKARCRRHIGRIALNGEPLTAAIIRTIMNRHREGLPKKWSVKFATALTVAALWRKYAQGL